LRSLRQWTHERIKRAISWSVFVFDELVIIVIVSDGEKRDLF
jgi:hypothetical protein